jgi:hypothetical protein
MNICGHGLRDHIRLLWPTFVFIAAIWLVRLVSGAAGLPLPVVRYVSVSGSAAVAVLFATIRIHTRGFGGYANVVAASLLLAAWSQLLVILAIIGSTLTGWINVYTAPEFSVPGPDKYNLRHIMGHLTYGIGALTLLGAAMGCLVFLILRTLVPIQPSGSNSRPPRSY